MAKKTISRGAHIAARRREEIARIVQRMAPRQRAGLIRALRAFTDAGGEPATDQTWDLVALGWTKAPGRRVPGLPRQPLRLVAVKASYWTVSFSRSGALARSWKSARMPRSMRSQCSEQPDRAALTAHAFKYLLEVIIALYKTVVTGNVS